MVDDFLSLDDRQLLAQCEVHTYRASGPGGQHRNKTDSAVRLHHKPTDVVVTATERRSQHENKARAIKRLREAIAIKVRQPIDRKTFAPPAWFEDIVGQERRLTLSSKSPAYWPTVRLLLDVLDACSASVADAAALLGITTGNFIRFIQDDPNTWQQANHIRAAHNCKPLR